MSLSLCQSAIENVSIEAYLQTYRKENINCMIQKKHVLRIRKSFSVSSKLRKKVYFPSPLEIRTIVNTYSIFIVHISVGSNQKIPNLEPPEPLVNRTSNLPNLFLDFKTEPNLKRPNLEPLLILK